MKSYFAEKSKPHDISDNLIIGSDTWLLKEARGNTLFDKFLFNSIKLTYKCLRLLFRIVLGKSGRDNLWTYKNISFRSFL